MIRIKTSGWWRSLLPVALAIASGVVGASESPVSTMANHAERMTAQFWIDALPAPDSLLMSDASRRAQNARLLADDPSMHDLAKLPSVPGSAQVRAWIEARSRMSSEPLYDEQGDVISSARRQAWEDALALDRISDAQALRYGLIVQRARLRTFPTDDRVFNRLGDTDIDRFQETAEFPGTPVAIVHESRDGEWYFVLSPRYSAWVRKRFVAIGTAQEVLGYAQASDVRVITAKVAHTVTTPELADVSAMALEMGTRLPTESTNPEAVVNGQASFASYVLKLPRRDRAGRLVFTTALLPRSEDSASVYLPMTPAQVIRQAFKFLGERYGWGNDYDARDCSGFISDVYRSLGVELPRNTGDEANSPVLRAQRFDGKSSHDIRMQAIDKLQVGDLLFIPGHVMMMIGRFDGAPYVIHDTAGTSYRDDGGQLHRLKLNQVVVTPLLPLLSDDGTSYVDRMTAIVHLRDPS